MDMPVLIVDNSFDGAILNFIRSLNFSCTILVDEAEKIFKLGEDDDVLLSKMDATIAHKEKLNAIYQKALPKSIQLPEAYQHWRFNIMAPNKEEVMQAIFDAGLFASGHYAPQSDVCPVAAKLYEHVINLFNDEYFTEEQAIRTCEVINGVLCKV